MGIGIKAIEYYLPDKILTNKELSEIYPGWSEEKIYDKTGIKSRHVVNVDETASDLAVKAVKKVFQSGVVKPDEIDFLLFATQSPDYLLPTTACIIQDRLGLPKSIGALDFNLGCSAYVYGLTLAKGVINSKIAKNILLVMSETYSKHIDPMDKSVRTIFGDGAAASLISEGGPEVLNFDLGTDGSGYDKLIIPAGGAVLPKSENTLTKENLYMDGAEIFNFSIKVVPDTVKKVLHKNNLIMEDIDLFVFHQANKFMLDFLRKKIKIPKEKFYINMEDIGNTVSASIPIALKRAETEGRISKGSIVMIVGFGVGLSWGSTILRY